MAKCSSKNNYKHRYKQTSNVCKKRLIGVEQNSTSNGSY